MHAVQLFPVQAVQQDGQAAGQNPDTPGVTDELAQATQLSALEVHPLQAVALHGEQIWPAPPEVRK